MRIRRSMTRMKDARKALESSGISRATKWCKWLNSFLQGILQAIMTETTVKAFIIEPQGNENSCFRIACYYQTSSYQIRRGMKALENL
jgi:hypothetical protein